MRSERAALLFLRFFLTGGFGRRLVSSRGSARTGLFDHSSESLGALPPLLRRGRRLVLRTPPRRRIPGRASLARRLLRLLVHRRCRRRRRRRRFAVAVKPAPRSAGRRSSHRRARSRPRSCRLCRSPCLRALRRVFHRARRPLSGSRSAASLAFPGLAPRCACASARLTCFGPAPRRPPSVRLRVQRRGEIRVCADVCACLHCPRAARTRRRDLSQPSPRTMDSFVADHQPR